MNMDEICGTCGKRYGEHFGQWCRPKGAGGTSFASTGRYRAATEEVPEPAPVPLSNDAKTLKDIRLVVESVQHWKRVADGSDEGTGPRNCPLCGEYHHGFAPFPCDGCPVKAESGHAGCKETPYQAWISHHDTIHSGSRKVRCPTCKHLAQEEAGFLFGLLEDLATSLSKDYLKPGMRVTNRGVSGRNTPLRLDDPFCTITRKDEDGHWWADVPGVGEQTAMRPGAPTGWTPVLTDEEIKEAVSGQEENAVPAPTPASYQFKEGTTLQDLLNTRPCLDELHRFLDRAEFLTLDPRFRLDSERCNKAANFDPIWQSFGLEHGLLEKVTPSLSLRLVVDGETVWQGEGERLSIEENGYWVMGLTKKGYSRIGDVNTTNIANDGDKILEGE